MLDHFVIFFWADNPSQITPLTTPDYSNDEGILKLTTFKTKEEATNFAALNLPDVEHFISQIVATT
jgi:hypothetical protein